MKSDRFLMGILLGIGVLVISALLLFYFRQGESRYSTENTPPGTIQNYVLALQNKDFKKAYGYIANFEGKPDFEQFRNYFVTSIDSYNRAGLSIGTSSESDNSAFVTVTVQQSYGGLFNEMSRSNETVDLVRQNGEWKIKRFPYPFWGYDWYENAPKP